LDKFTVYQDRAGEWRWQLKARNGKIIADSGEGYASEYNAVRAARRCKELAPSAPVTRPDGTVLNERQLANVADPF
jgi:uncharacterized protein YegP (UPF0339 family)